MRDFQFQNLVLTKPIQSHIFSFTWTIYLILKNDHWIRYLPLSQWDNFVENLSSWCNFWRVLWISSLSENADKIWVIQKSLWKVISTVATTTLDFSNLHNYFSNRKRKLLDIVKLVTNHDNFFGQYFLSAEGGWLITDNYMDLSAYDSWVIVDWNLGILGV